MNILYHYLFHYLLQSLKYAKPIGIKIVVGDLDALEKMTKTMRDTGKGPDFITVDGGEGGTGATYQFLQMTVGLPIM